MLRIKILKEIYDDTSINYLLFNFDKFTVDLIGSYLVKGYTLDNSTYKAIHTMESRNTYSYFYKTIWDILTNFDKKDGKLNKVKQCEYLFRYINMYYPLLISMKYYYLVTVIKEKILELLTDSMYAIQEAHLLIRHNVNTRLNKKQIKYIDCLCVHVEKFNRECKECLTHIEYIIAQRSL